MEQDTDRTPDFYEIDVPAEGVTSLAPIRSQLIAKGMIWSPSHGDTAFTVPLFDGFMQRIMPGDDWKTVC